MIEVKHLTKRYGETLALDDVSFTMKEGRVYGLLGPNGAGKSTTMNIMTGYLAATDGTVTIDGHDIVEESREAKALIGYLPEQPPLYTDMTTEEYLMYAAGIKGVPRKEREEEVTRVAEQVGLEPVLNRMIRNLSKGFRQRVGLAQAILGHPHVVILDEPTVGLDPQQVIEVRNIIRDLGRDHTVILSSHILSEVAEVCDYVYIISHGRLVAADRPEQLARNLQRSQSLEIFVQGSRSAVQRELGSLAGLGEITYLPGQGAGSTAFRLTLEGDEDRRAEISMALASQGLPVLSMQQKTLSLEEIFLALTEGDPKEEEPARAEDPVPDAGNEEEKEEGSGV